MGHIYTKPIMTATYILKSANKIINGSKVKIRGKDQSEIDRKKDELESNLSVLKLEKEDAQ
jgi:hypothetical protein